MPAKVFLALVFTWSLASCTNLSSNDDGGGGGGIGGTAGTGGTGGSHGTAGTGGTSGVGGTGATGIDPCSDIMLNEAAEMNASFSSGGGMAGGTVCSVAGASCDDDTDVQHVWSMQALCEGLYVITLTWTDDTMANNLDLALFDEDGEEPLEPDRPSDTKEYIEIVLGVTETYTIEVTATDTAGQDRAYTLTVKYGP